GRAQRAQEEADLDPRARAARGHPRLHPRGGRPQPRARARHGPAQGGDEHRLREGRAAGRPRGRHPARRARPAALLPGGGRPHRGAGRRDRAGVHAGRRRRPLHRGELDSVPPPQERSDAHRAARRRHEGVGADRADVRASARGRARHRRGRVRGPRVPRPRPRGSDPEGRTERGRHDDHGAGVAADRPPGQAHGRHDRRGHAAGPRAPDRRAQAEGARRPRRRADRRGHPGAQPRRPRRRPRGGPRGHDLPPGHDRRRGARGRTRAGAGRHRHPRV
ncbi:MAG: ATP-dependent protease La Type I, partial [uncultured Solirubrobacteraceae bacterium]